MAIRYFWSRGVSIPAGSTVTVEYVPETDVRLNRVLCTERSAASLNNVHAEIKIMDELVTRPTVPLTCFGETLDRGLIIDREVKKGQTVRFTITNAGTTAVYIDIVAEIL